MVKIVDKIDEFQLLYKHFNHMRLNAEAYDEEQLHGFVKCVLLDLIKIEKVKQVENNLKAYLEMKI